MNPLRYKHLDRWVPQYLFPAERRESIDPSKPVDIYLSVCDHYEPETEGADVATALARVDRWVTEYPKLFGEFRDSDGRCPQHTFFYPQDQYRPEYLDRLAELCHAGYGDVDVHLHHDNDTEAGLFDKMSSFRDDLYFRHNLLRKNDNGQIVYGFIHGNWALCNSRDDGRWCGVDQELTVLLNTGCYADFTMPSAPSTTQTPTINSIYYAQDKPGQRRSHFDGIRARIGQAAPADHLLMIQGPLALDWSSRKFGLLPRTENADIHGNFVPTLERFKLWLKTGVHVAGAPNTVFIKLHTHGCKPGNIERWLSPAIQTWHREMLAFVETQPNLRLHYCTAWEMAQLVHQLESNETTSERPIAAAAHV